MVCMASQGKGDEQKGGSRQRNGEASQRKATALNRAHLTERQWNGNEPLISDEQWHGRSKRRKLGNGNSKHNMNGTVILRRNKFMFSHLADTVDGDQVVFVRSAEGHSHILNNKSRYKVGDEVAIAGIVKITAIQPQNNGTVSYSTDRGISIHEELLEQIKIKPKPVVEKKRLEPNERVLDHKFKVGEEVRTRFGFCRVFDIDDTSIPYCVVDITNTRHWLTEDQIHPTVPVINPQKPLYSGKVVAISASPKAFSISLATNRIGRIFEIADGVLVGNRDDLYEKYGFVCEYDSPVHSFGEFCNCHAMNEWLELKS